MWRNKGVQVNLPTFQLISKTAINNHSFGAGKLGLLIH